MSIAWWDNTADGCAPRLLRPPPRTMQTSTAPDRLMRTRSNSEPTFKRQGEPVCTCVAFAPPHMRSATLEPILSHRLVAHSSHHPQSIPSNHLDEGPQHFLCLRKASSINTTLCVPCTPSSSAMDLCFLLHSSTLEQGKNITLIADEEAYSSSLPSSGDEMCSDLMRSIPMMRCREDTYASTSTHAPGVPDQNEAQGREGSNDEICLMICPRPPRLRPPPLGSMRGPSIAADDDDRAGSPHAIYNLRLKSHLRRVPASTL